MYRDIPTDLLELIEPIVRDHGLELVDIEAHRGRTPWSVRVIVDSPQGDGCVPVDTCGEVSREIETNLDALEDFPQRYQLEVTSPGLDRWLGREVDFERACGSTLKVETRVSVNGARRFRGVLAAFQNQLLLMDVDGRRVEIAFDQVSKATRVYEFTDEDFGKHRKQAKAKKLERQKEREAEASLLEE